MAIVHSMETVLERSCSRRRISRELGIDARRSVDTPVRLAVRWGRGLVGEHRAMALIVTGAQCPPRRLPARRLIQQARTKQPRSSKSGTPLRRAVILAKLEGGLSAGRILQDPTAEHGSAHQYHSVRRFVQPLRGARPLPFHRLPERRPAGRTGSRLTPQQRS